MATIVVVSLGQLISSNAQILKTSFVNYLATKHQTVSDKDIWEWLVPFLPQLRLAKMDLAALWHEFNEEFDVDMPLALFTSYFNSMSTLDAASVQKIKDIHAYLSFHPEIRIVVVSHTNWSHFNYIMDQLEAIMPDVKERLVGTHNPCPDNGFLFAPSMLSQFAEHQDTLNWALKQLNIAPNQPTVSLLNTIKERPNTPAAFQYIEAPNPLTAQFLVSNLVLNAIVAKRTNREPSFDDDFAGVTFSPPNNPRNSYLGNINQLSFEFNLNGNGLCGYQASYAFMKLLSETTLRPIRFALIHPFYHASEYNREPYRADHVVIIGEGEEAVVIQPIKNRVFLLKEFLQNSSQLDNRTYGGNIDVWYTRTDPSQEIAVLTSDKDTYRQPERLVTQWKLVSSHDDNLEADAFGMTSRNK